MPQGARTLSRSGEIMPLSVCAFFGRAVWIESCWTKQVSCRTFQPPFCRLLQRPSHRPRRLTAPRRGCSLADADAGAGAARYRPARGFVGNATFFFQARRRAFPQSPYPSRCVLVSIDKPRLSGAKPSILGLGLKFRVRQKCTVFLISRVGYSSTTFFK